MRIARLIAARATTLLRRLGADRAGNVLMIMAFALIPMTFATGMAIDYSRAARLQTKLNGAADAAALSGTTKPMLQQPLLSACNTVRRTFLNALQQGAAGLTLTPADLSISVTEGYAAAGDVTFACPPADAAVPITFNTPTRRTVTVIWQGASANAFGGVLGASAIQIGGTSVARSTQATYYQIAFVVDVSSSMGIGGTSADIGNLNNDANVRCAFACHDPNSTGGQPSATTYCEANPMVAQCRANSNFCPSGSGCPVRSPSPVYSDKRLLAKLYGYRLKIDYVNDAVSAFIDSLQPRMPSGSDTYAVSIVTFGSSYATLQPSTTDWSTLNANRGRIDLETAARSPAGYPNQGWTYASTGLRNLRNSLRNVGDGSSPTARATYVIFISDGVQDAFDVSDQLRMYNRTSNYNYAQECAATKAAGMTMFSIETAYPEIPNDGQYDVLVRDLPSRNGGKQIADVMRDCASSPNRYFMAGDGDGIKSAVDQVFTMIATETSHLTQ